MDALLVGLRILLAGVFALAGIAKLAGGRAGLAAFRTSLGEFGVPGRLAGPLALTLPVAELAVAGALLPAGTAWWGAAGALVLLLAFTAVVALNLARGRRPACNCFGTLGTSRIGVPTLVRNLALAAAAVAVLAVRGPGQAGPAVTAGLAGGRLSGGSGVVTVATGLVLAAAVVGLGWAMLQLVRQQGRLLARIEQLEKQAEAAGRTVLPLLGPDGLEHVPRPDHGHHGHGSPRPAALPVGAPAPELVLAGLDGDQVRLADFAGAATLLLFWNPSCGFCQQLLPALVDWEADPPAGAPRLVLISQGGAEANRRQGLAAQVLLDDDFTAGRLFGATGTPMAVLLDERLTVASGLAAGAAAVLDLAGRRAAGGQPRPDLLTRGAY